MAEEIGYQSGGGLVGWGTYGTDVHEKNVKLLWPESIDVYDEMRNDSQVGSVLNAITSPILAASYSINPAGARDEVVERISQDLGLPIKGQDPVPPKRRRGRFSWIEHLSHTMLMLPFGHAFFEQSYAVVEDGYRLRKLAWRPHRSIQDIVVARDGGLVGIKQYGVERMIPVDRLVAYVNQREGGNWLGRSILRTAYKPWLLKDRVLRAGALVVERNGLGIPTFTGAPVPDSITEPAKRKEWQEAALAAGLEIVQSLRSGERAGVALNDGEQIALMGVTGKLPDLDKPLRYYDEQIARGALAMFLNLGGDDSTGSYALGDTFEDFFTGSLNRVSRHVVDVTQQHVVEDYVDLQWNEDEVAPQLEVAPIGAEHPLTAEAIRALIDCGALTPDGKLEQFIREKWGLPAREATGDAEPDGDLTAKDAEAARAAAEVVQKAYLGVGPLLTRREARDLARRAGASLDSANDDRDTTASEEAAA